MRPLTLAHMCAVLCITTSALAGPPLVLGPADVTERILAENLGIAAAKEDVGMASADLVMARGAHDLTVASSVTHQIDKFARSAPSIFGTRTDSTQFALDLGKKWQTGTETSLGFALDRSKTFGSTFISPLQHQAEVSMSVRQPLMNNVGGYQDRRRLTRARRALEATDLRYRWRVAERVHHGLQAYWTWFFTHQQLQIAQAAVTAAQEFLTITEERHSLGTALDADLFAAQSNVETRRAQVASVEVTLLESAQQVRQQIRLAPMQHIRPRITQAPHRYVPGAIAADVTQALTARPDHRALREDVEQFALQLQAERNARWPTLDLIGSLALNQLTTASMGSAIGGTDNPKWAAGIASPAAGPNGRAMPSRRRSSPSRRVKRPSRITCIA
jgi:outer membrane protein TolC